MSLYTIGQAVEVCDEQGVWTQAVIRSTKGEPPHVQYQVMFPAGLPLQGRTQSTDIEGHAWWPSFRVRPDPTPVMSLDEYMTTLTEQGLISLRMCIREVIKDENYDKAFLQEVRRFPLLLEALKATRKDWELYDFSSFWFADLAQAIHKRAFDLLEQSYRKLPPQNNPNGPGWISARTDRRATVYL